MASATIPSSIILGEEYAGAFDYLEVKAGLRGWAFALDRPGDALALEAVCKGVVLADSYSVLDRPDIDIPAGRVTHAGFIIGWSRFDVASLSALSQEDPDAEIEVRLAGGHHLPTVREPVRAAQLLSLVRAAPLGDMQEVFREANEYIEIAKSGVFDPAWYAAQYAATYAPTTPPLLDYIRRGEAEGTWPNLFFDPAAYADSAMLADRPGALLHYVRRGAGGAPLPSPLFDARWYARQHRTEQGPGALAHYLKNRHRFAPNPWFDREHYAAQSGLPQDGDLFEHFITQGFGQGLTPSDRNDQRTKRAGILPLTVASYISGLPAIFGWPATQTARDIAATPKPAAPIESEAAVAMAGPPAAPASIFATRPAPAALAVSAAAIIAEPPPRGKPDYATIEARLRALPSAELIRTVQAAEKAALSEGTARAEAALTLAVARNMGGDRLGGARATITYLMTTTGEAARDDTLALLALANHVLYEQSRGEEALAVYRLLHEAGLQDFLVILRLVEGAVDKGDVATAAPFAEELLAKHQAQMNVWAWLALSRFHAASQQPDKALAILRAIPPYPATDAIPESVVLHRLIENAPVSEALARFAGLGPDLPQELRGPRFRIAVREADLATLQELTTDTVVHSIPDWQLKEGMFLLLADGRVTGPEGQRFLRQLYRAMELRGLENDDLVQARCHYLLQNRRWDELGALFEAIEGRPIATQRETLLRKLEYYCYADNPEGAEAIYREHFRDTVLTKWEGLAMLRLFSEQKRWDEAGKLLVQHVSQGHDFGGATHAAMRVVRKASLHEAVLHATANLNPPPSPPLEEFLGLVQEDQSILESARGLTANLHSGARSVRYRTRWLVEDSDHFNDALPDHCLFLCTNQRYFLSLLTFLCSFLGQAPQASVRIFVFLDQDVPRHWYGALAMLGARFNTTIEIVPESDFIQDDIEHRVDYGFFAGGSALSRAAYFRLYAARYLLTRHSFRRAVYIDTDIICRGDLTGLFEYALGDNLIAAATEDFSLDVVNAASRNNLDPLAYFNSGVLVMRFDDEGLRARIDKAIQISETEPERLMFHDQCALNIAFNGATEQLASRYNFFLRPSRTRNGHIEDGLLLHFLDKPKPWDIVFDRTYREEWRVWALFLGTILPQRLYVNIFAAANRD